MRSAPLSTGQPRPRRHRLPYLPAPGAAAPLASGLSDGVPEPLPDAEPPIVMATMGQSTGALGRAAAGLGEVPTVRCRGCGRILEQDPQVLRLHLAQHGIEVAHA
jgi:hypothetical protein